MICVWVMPKNVLLEPDPFGASNPISTIAGGTTKGREEKNRTRKQHKLPSEQKTCGRAK